MKEKNRQTWVVTEICIIVVRFLSIVLGQQQQHAQEMSFHEHN